MDAAIEGVIIRPLTHHTDERGWLCELFRRDEIDPGIFPAMGYVSVTLPGVTRGPHEHRDQTDFFGFTGPSDFKIYLWDNRPASPTYRAHHTLIVGESFPCAVVLPPGIAHAYTNVGAVPGYVFNAPNRLYRGEGRTQEVDEIRHEDSPDSPFAVG